MTNQPGQAISQAFAEASDDNWSGQFRFHEDRAPGHMIVSQIAALVGDDADELLHVEVSVGTSRRLEELTISAVIFTKDLLIIVDLEAGGEPKSRVYPRAALTALTVTSVPVITMPTTGSGWQPWKVELKYPDNDISLPFEEYSRRQSDSVGRLLPGLVKDLAAAHSSKAL